MPNELEYFAQIDDLSPSDFEHFVKDTFEAAGWSDMRVTIPNKEYAHGDGGVDIFGSKDGRRFAFEVKQRADGATIGVGALNQLVTGARLAGVKQMVLVTNSYFTSQVAIRAMRLGIELFDRERLQTLWVERHSEIGRHIRPRKYQQAVIDEVVEKTESGKSRFLLEMATGLGKTYTAAHLCRTLSKKRSWENLRVLFVAHRVEILVQSVTAFKNVFGIGGASYSVCFDGAAPEDTNFVFASFTTLHTYREALAREQYHMVIVDEAHHAAASTYAAVMDSLAPDIMLGLTATPERADGQRIEQFFGGNEGHVGRLNLMWALKHGQLAFPKYEVLLDDIDAEAVAEIESGLGVRDIDDRLFIHRKDEEVVRIIESTIEAQDIDQPKAIVFCKGIDHIQHLIQFFPPGSATIVYSKEMSMEQRRENIRHFRESECRYILVCDLFNEGIDIPETNVLVFLRSTSSKTVWLQQLGRGLRKTKNKNYVHVLDFVGSIERIADVENFAQKVRECPLDPECVETKDLAEVVHNRTIEVNYSRSAADILALLEQSELRLNTRRQAINELRKYVLKSGSLPDLENFDCGLPGVVASHVLTHFGSLLGFIRAAFGDGSVHEETLRKNALNRAEAHEAEHGVWPSLNLLTRSGRLNELPIATATELEELLIDYRAGSDAGKARESENEQLNEGELSGMLDSWVTRSSGDVRERE